jgi:hypothetical protein
VAGKKRKGAARHYKPKGRNPSSPRRLNRGKVKGNLILGRTRMTSTKQESPILIHGTLHCPCYRTPLTTEDIGEEKYRCVYCSRLVGKLTDEVILEMARNVPINMYREWNRELT